jgi:hypothetical protein
MQRASRPAAIAAVAIKLGELDVVKAEQRCHGQTTQAARHQKDDLFRL